MATLLEKIGKFYKVSVKCTNCMASQELKIPKGTTISNFITSEDAVCEKCGCSTLELKPKMSTARPSEPSKYLK